MTQQKFLQWYQSILVIIAGCSIVPIAQALEKKVTLSENALFRSAASNLSVIQEGLGDAECKATALQSYNDLRKIFNMPQVSSLADVDQAWLTETGYSLYKNSQRDAWIKKNITTTAQKAQDLIDTLYIWLDISSTATPLHAFAQQEALYTYNFLRELLHAQPAALFNQIDQKWVNTAIAYNLWKDAHEKYWRTRNISTKADKRDDLLKDLIELMSLMKENPDATNTKEALFTYNFLMELLGLPHATTIKNIDTNRLKKLEQEVLYAEVLELSHVNHYRPTFAYEQLIKEAQQISNIKGPLFPVLTRRSEVLGHAGEVLRHNTPFVALRESPDLGDLLFTVYHEMSHVINRDQAASDWVGSYGERAQQLLDTPNVQKTIKDVNHFVELGKKALDQTTRTGRTILQAVASAEGSLWHALRHSVLMKWLYGTPQQETPFWDPPTDKNIYTIKLLNRSQEQRADLFAAEQLHEQHDLFPILQEINFRAEGTITASPEDDQSSDLEEALYLTGFLVDKGLDINKLFRDWEIQGACTPLYNYTHPFRPSQTPAKALALPSRAPTNP